MRNFFEMLIKELRNMFETLDNALKKIIKERNKWGAKIVKFFPLWITPDGITITRLWCSLPIIFFILTKKKYLALVFFIFGSFLDFLDGQVAIARNQETESGAKLDAVVDKIFLGATLMTLFLASPLLLSKPLFWIVISTESVLIFLGAFEKNLVAFKGLKRKIGANNWGKIKFTLYCLGTFFLFRGKPLIARKFLWTGVFFACASIISHTFKDDE